jgi:hypothetical protein
LRSRADAIRGTTTKRKNAPERRPNPIKRTAGFSAGGTTAYKVPSHITLLFVILVLAARLLLLLLSRIAGTATLLILTWTLRLIALLLLARLVLSTLLAGLFLITIHKEASSTP